MAGRKFLIDVSRLIWRVWKGRLPTGIDRVCLAYLQQFGTRAQAVVQHNGRRRILSVKHSDRLFALLLEGGPQFRSRLMRLIPRVALRGLLGVATDAQIYLNIGHTGLDEPGLPDWLARLGVKPVFLVHDLIPLTHPEFCRVGEAEKHEQRMRNVLLSATGIIGNSQATLEEMARFAAERQLPMPSAVAAWISGYPTPEVCVPRKLDRPYFVTVGTIEGRKNHVLLLELWQRLAARLGDRTPRLLIIGQRGWEAEHAIAMLDRAHRIKPHVRELGRCEDDELAGLIAGSRALLMPSFAEGFGLPVVEALAIGAPVIVSDLPVFREIGGTIPTFLDATDGAGWERQIMAFMEDCPERQRQLAALPDYRAPDWPTHFVRVEAWLETL